MFPILRHKVLIVFASLLTSLLIAATSPNAVTARSAGIQMGLTNDSLNAQPQIVFSSHRNVDWEVYMMNADGSDQRQITYDGPENEARFPSWSPDGKWITFNTGYVIQVMDTQGKNVRKLTDYGSANGWFPAWSPDGKQIAFAGGQGHVSQLAICVMNADGSGFRELTSNNVENDFPAWSPDGNTIVFASRRDGE